MTQTLVVVVLFVAAMACLPWLVRRLQQRHGAGQIGTGPASRVLSTVAVGPQQRVVTVEVGPEHARTWLVLGVTAQQMTCLHVLPVSAPPTPASFAQEMAAARSDGPKADHG
ncbi:MAG: flagellar biosynthetic protein FliO [Acidovorax sp.]|uniref:FliO/MopB family protein n=1 Tax=Acidovorax sp. TaxID=1872122 RepID=UPI0039E6A4E5